MIDISRVKKILLVSLFLAMNIILKRVLVVRYSPSLSFSFCFVPVILCAIILGTRYTVLLEALTDILGWLMFPRGMFFIGYTISAMIVGFIYGKILHPRDGVICYRSLLPKLTISILLVAIIVSIGLNTWWLFLITKNGIRIMLPIKIVKQIVTVPIKVTTMYYTVKLLEPKLNTEIMC